MADIGLLITGLAVGVAAAFGRGSPITRAALVGHWGFVVAMVSFGLDKASTVAALTSADLFVAVVAVLLTGHNIDHPRTRIVGILALLVMPLHLVMSATTGKLNWTLYAASLNAVFVLQCLVSSGACDGLGRRLAALHDWLYGPAFRRHEGK